ncbi:MULTISPECIES: PhoX family phosphatase [unclassified Mycobacterium]|uniref:PhoX family protein n=1 Tax=unclassified Mycobacterium TaxID=2642494 RepID=UPI00073FD845|nr:MULTISPECIES: PhoX family phosphatase [unclassified Mycobacterium]KUH85607.1 phosphatase [Mycobacterium sp. GA-1999]KUH91465.1 phosphatase [Mycobacterium sp. GA-0227b]KUH96281.1 phosphatase [Mycobacterium sp. IS-1556]
MALVPLNLFVAHDGKSKRQHVTCRYKCGDACSKPVPNTSGNEYFGDVVKAVSRRSMLRAGGIAVLAVGTASALASCGRDDQPAPAPTSPAPPADPPAGMRFASVAPNSEDAVVIPDGYRQAVVISWGDPVLPGAPPFDVNNQSGAAQRGQFGFNNDFAGLLPIPGQPNRFLLVTNFEYVTPQFMFPGYDADKPTREQFEVEIAAVGMGVVEVESTPNGLTPVSGRYNRRITADTPFTLTGPAAGSEFVKTEADPDGRTVAGTFANCAGGVTPWGTVLSGEENFDSYFGGATSAPGPGPVDADRRDRYGITAEPSELLWETFDPRFDLARNPHEVNRFGYVVELNPWDPNSTPVKHSALGRLKHEGASIYVTDDGTVVAYTGDDERFDYMYKFVSDKKIRPGRDAAAMAHNMTILDEGTLYVAKLSSDIPANEIDGSGKPPSTGAFTGTGTWVPLLHSGPDDRAESLVDGVSAQEAAVFTRIAADKAGATKMDRPEDFEANPKTGKVYVALTNNDERGAAGEAPADAANPRNDNKNGQILEITDNHAGTDFTWELLLVCGDPAAADTYFAGFDKTRVSPISCPDNLAFDSHGNLWISTDGNALNSNDGLFAVALDGPNRGETRQFLTVPLGAETCGPVVTDDVVTICVQHPGEHDDNSIDAPLSRWPEGGNGTARPSVVAVWKADGNIGV